MKVLLTVLLFMTTQLFAADVMLHGGHIRFLPKTSKVTGAFMNLMNHTDKDLKLVSVKGEDAERYELHTHTMEGGMMKMRQVSSMELKAQSTLELKPGGLHIMLINLKNPLVLDQKMKMTLVFDNGLELPIELPVKKVMGHSKHKH